MSAADKYEQIRILGEGSFGKVYLMRDKVRRALVCVKVIKIRNIPRKEREATRMEVDLLRRLNHPNIVRYLDSFSSSRGESLCIAMEYCDGGDLASQIANQSKNNRRQLFGENKILHWFVQMTLGLHYMHTNKVLHRDLKTQNVFLLGNGRLVLGDLGISKVLDGTMDFAQTCIGTPYYMSPEIFKNKPYSYKSDIWALGCVLYEMTTLKHAFDATSLSSLAQKIIKGRFVPVSTKYSRNLKELINRMLHVSPSVRPDCDQILRMPFIKRHIVNFFVDIHNRPSTNIGEGTMIVRGAIGQASDVQAHLRNDNNMLSLREQLKHLDMTEDMATALSPQQASQPVKSGSDLRRRVRDQTSALRREEDHKKMVESALERLRKEKEVRAKERANAINVMPQGGRGAGRPRQTGASNVSAQEQDRLAIYREKQAKERAEDERRRERERKEKREHERERQVSAKDRLREREIAHRNRLEEEARQKRIAAFHEDERLRKVEAERVDQKRREEIRVEARRKEESRIREEIQRKEEAKREEDMSSMMAQQRQDLIQAKQAAAERRNQQREKEKERQRKEIEQLKMDKLMLDQRTADREAKKKERRDRERSDSRNSNSSNVSNNGSNVPSREPTPPPRSSSLASGDDDNDVNNSSIFKGMHGGREGDVSDNDNTSNSKKDAVLQRAQAARLKEAAERSEVLKAQALANRVEREKAVVRGRSQYVSSPDTSNAVGVGVGQPGEMDAPPPTAGGGKGADPGNNANMDLDALTEKLQQATKGQVSRFGNKAPGGAGTGTGPGGYGSRFDYGDDDSSDDDDLLLKQAAGMAADKAGTKNGNTSKHESKSTEQREEEVRLSQDFHRMFADEDEEESLFGDVDSSSNSEMDADIEAREEELQQELSLSLARVDVLKKTVQDTVTFAVKVDSSVGNITRIGEIGRVAAKDIGESVVNDGKHSGPSSGPSSSHITSSAGNAKNDSKSSGGSNGSGEGYLIEEEEDSEEDEEEDEILKSLLREVTNQGSPPRSARGAKGKDEGKSEDDIITPRRVIRPDMAVQVNTQYDHPSDAPPAYADLADPPSPLGKLGQRSERLRQHLLSNIGQEAFDAAYDYLKRRESDESLGHEDVDLDKDPVLVSILGDTRMQYAEDVDQLIFLENFHQG